MTGVAVHLHHCAPVLYQIEVADLFAHQRFVPMLDKAVRRLHVSRKALPAMADRAAVFVERMFLQNFLRVRFERVGHAVQPFHSMP